MSLRKHTSSQEETHNLLLINNRLELHYSIFMKALLIGCFPYFRSTQYQKEKIAEIIVIQIMNKIESKDH